MGEGWAYYPSQVDEMPSSIYLNLSLKDRAPIPELPEMVWLRLTMRHPRSDGLDSEAEFSRLCEIEEAVTVGLKESMQFLYVGRNTSDGCRDYFFYATEPEAAERDLRSRMLQFVGYSFETGHRSEPEWTTYLEFLYPSKREHQSMLTLHQFEALEEKGDQHETPRPVDHTLNFPSTEGREEVTDVAINRGFEVARTHDKDGRFGVTLRRSDPVTYKHLNQVVLELFDLAANHEGDYEGWHSPVTSAD